MIKRIIGIFFILLIAGVSIILSQNKLIIVEENSLDNDNRAIIIDGNMKIELVANDLLDNKNSDIFVRIPQNYSLIINEKEYPLEIKNTNHVISLGLADLNMDGEKEILVCTSDMSISPSYRMWQVYSLTDNLEYIQEIHDGEIKYNKLFNVLSVSYKLSETRIPMTETVKYKFDWGKLT